MNRFFCFVANIYWGTTPCSNFLYRRGITPKRVTGGDAHLRSLAPGQGDYEERSQR